jgi:hypothetical protein
VTQPLSLWSEKLVSKVCFQILHLYYYTVVRIDALELRSAIRRAMLMGPVVGLYKMNLVDP